MFGIGGCEPPQPTSFEGEGVIREWPLVSFGRERAEQRAAERSPGRRPCACRRWAVRHGPRCHEVLRPCLHTPSSCGRTPAWWWFSAPQRKECLRRVSFPPPLCPVGTFFSAPDQRSETRRMRAFAANCPNHERRCRRPFWAVFRLYPPLFSDATEPRPFWYGCQKIAISRTYTTSEQTGFEGPAQAVWARIEQFSSVRVLVRSLPCKSGNSPDRGIRHAAVSTRGSTLPEIGPGLRGLSLSISAAIRSRYAWVPHGAIFTRKLRPAGCLRRRSGLGSGGDGGGLAGPSMR
jgi:hypothetical protein